MQYSSLFSSHRISEWRVFAPVHFTLDALALTIGWHAARTWALPEQLRGAIPSALIIVVLWTLTAFARGLYRRKEAWTAAHAIRQAIESDLAACGLALFASLFVNSTSTEVSRAFVLAFAPSSLALLVLSFYAAMMITGAIQKKWCAPKRVAILGGDPELATLLRELEAASSGALTVTGAILTDASDTPPGLRASSGLRVLGTIRQLAEVINRESLDQLICPASVSMHELELCGAISHRMGVTISRPLAPPLSQSVRFKFYREYGVDFLDAEPVPFTQKQQWVKRFVDVIGSAVLLIVLSPLLAVLALLIRLTSPGPILYKSLRVGRGGRYFTFLKFRSMYANGLVRGDLVTVNEKRGHLFKIRNDPRVTPLGRVMRRFSLDELPQLGNVLLGEMSLVGPRPLPSEDLNPDGLSEQHAVWADQRVRVLPGITGLWQIRGRSELSFEQMMELDMHYLRNWSLALDIQILLETPLAALGGRGAY
jgi:exopolysaccharide biosynthesis polyprenyl glycosylphosphotransferase